jgi:hypothetical protein
MLATFHSAMPKPKLRVDVSGCQRIRRYDRSPACCAGHPRQQRSVGHAEDFDAAHRLLVTVGLGD